MLIDPPLLEPRDGVGRQPLGLIPQQRRERLLVISGGDALEVQPRDQLLDAAGALEVGREQAGVEPCAPTAAITHLRHPHRDLADAGLHSALWQVAVAHHRLAPVLQALPGNALQEARQLRLDGLGDQLPCPRPQQRVQRVRFPNLWL